MSKTKVAIKKRLIASAFVLLAGLALPQAAQAGDTTFSGTVWQDANGDGLRQSGEAVYATGVNVVLLDSGGSVVASATTNASGYYEFPSSFGKFRVRVTKPAGYNFSPKVTGGSSVDPATGLTAQVNVNGKQSDLTRNIGLVKPVPTPPATTTPTPTTTTTPPPTTTTSPTTTTASTSTSTATTDTTTTVPAPSVPTGFAGAAISTTQINLSWNAAANANGYQIGYCVKSNFTGEVSTGLGNVTSFSATNLLPNTTYYFRVRAKNIYSLPLGYVPSAYTATVAVKTPDSVTTTTPPPTTTTTDPTTTTPPPTTTTTDPTTTTPPPTTTTTDPTTTTPPPTTTTTDPTTTTPPPTTTTTDPTTTTPPPTTTTDPTSPYTDEYFRQRIISCFIIGNSSVTDADRRVGQNIKTYGWNGFVTNRVKPVLDWGVRRIELHLPFGCSNSTEAMDLDGYVEAKEAGLTWLTDGFVEAWVPVIRGDYTNGEKVEVIAYFGSLRSDMDMKNRLVEVGAAVVDCLNTAHPVVGHITLADGTYADDTGKVLGKVDTLTGEQWDNAHIPPRMTSLAMGSTKWIERANASVAPAIAAGMSIAFDGGSGLTAYHPGYAFVKKIKDAGTRTYIESWPDRTESWWTDANVLIASNTWYSSWFLKSGWPMKRTSMTGEVIRMITLPGITTTDASGNLVCTTTKAVTNADGTISYVPLNWTDVHNGYDEAIWSLANNYTVLLSIKDLISAGYTMDNVIQAARNRALGLTD